jgi:hypothetical protein
MGERKERKSRLKGDEYGTARFRKKGARLLSFEGGVTVCLSQVAESELSHQRALVTLKCFRFSTDRPVGDKFRLHPLVIRKIGNGKMMSGKMMEEEIHGGTEGKKITAQGGRVRNSKVPEKRCEVVIVRA